MDLVIFVVATVVAFLIATYFYILSRLDDLKQRWVEYRCNPLYMPFAGLVGVDVAGNFTRCTMRSFQDYTGFILDPINHLFGSFLQMFQSIADSLQSMRHMFNGIRNGFLGIVSQIFGKMANTMSQFQYLTTRIRTVMMRMMGIFAIMIHILNTGVASGKSVVNGPVGQTIRFFDQLCFDADQPIQLAGGAQIRMSEVMVGDTLADGGTVLSTYLFVGHGTILYDYKGVRVTGSHRLADGRFVRDLPEAIPMQSVPQLVCLDTTTGHILVGGVLFKDFERERTPLHAVALGQSADGRVMGLRRSQTGWEVLLSDG